MMARLRIGPKHRNDNRRLRIDKTPLSAIDSGQVLEWKHREIDSAKTAEEKRAKVITVNSVFYSADGSGSTLDEDQFEEEGIGKIEPKWQPALPEIWPKTRRLHEIQLVPADEAALVPHSTLGTNEWELWYSRAAAPKAGRRWESHRFSESRPPMSPRSGFASMTSTRPPRLRLRAFSRATTRTRMRRLTAHLLPR